MEWTRDFAYAVGLITTDGCLSKDRRHIDLTSKDLEQIQNFIKVLHLTCKIGLKHGTYRPDRTYYHVQFGDTKLYNYLLKIGLTPNKTKTIGPLSIPEAFFADFLRGHLDGDGSTSSFWDSKYPNSFRFNCVFVSASVKHIMWLKQQIEILYRLQGSMRYVGKSVFELRFAKKSATKLVKIMYYSNNIVCLKRKWFKIEKALAIISAQAGMLKSVNRPD